MKHFLSIISLILAAAIVSSTDSISSAAPITSDDESSQPVEQQELSEFEQVLKLIADYGVFMFDSLPPNRDNYDIVDKTKRIPTKYISRSETSDGVPTMIVLDENSINQDEWRDWYYISP